MVSKVVRGEQNKTHDYYFINADENAIEKARAKFSNDVANEVEKLMNENCD